MEHQKYQYYSAEMLALDDDFRRWVQAPKTEEETFWQEYILRYPEQRDEVEKAKAILKAIHQYYTVDAAPTEIEASFTNVEQRIQASNAMRIVRKKRWQAWQIAASILFLIGLSALIILYFQSAPSMDVYATDFGKQQEVTLPDGSVVMLNANSKLRTSNKWKAKTREVWLEGEAYFSVTKIPSTQAKFIVHTPDLNVEVYGTHFNVNTRKEKTQVVLEEGDIHLRFTDDTVSKELAMKPGDIVYYNKVIKKVERKSQPTRAYTSWKDGVLLFESAKLEEVADRIEEIYEVQLIIPKNQLKALPIKASLPVNNLKECLETLELLLLSEGVALKIQGDTIIVQ